MATPIDVEPFPELTPTPSLAFRAGDGEVHRRRKSSNLRGDPRGDTATPSLATLYDQSPTATGTNSPIPKTEKPVRRSKRKRVKSFFRRWKNYSMKHTWLNPLIVCVTIVLAYAVHPTSSNPVYPALFLSYPLPRDPKAAADAPIQYGKGARDFAFVAFYTVFLSFTREFLMQRFLRPLAIRCGILSRGKQARFMEQTYTAMYFVIFGPFGLYVMSRTPIWFFNTQAMYEGFPHQTHEAIFKAYYLLQASYWAQQMIVLLLMLEKPRKDFKELVAHHIITLSLIWLSYRFHFTHMGIAVYITHDISDFFLETSKVLNYIDSPIVIPYFVIFICTWTYLRHYQNLRILVSMLPLPSPFPDPVTAQLNSILTTVSTSVSTIATPILTPLANSFTTLFPETASLLSKAVAHIAATQPFSGVSQFASVGPYTLDWAGQQYKCSLSQWITFSLLAALQTVNLFWLFLIMRILWRVVGSMGEEIQDDRSEYDSDEEEQRQEDLAAEKKAELAAEKTAAGRVQSSNGVVKH